MTKFPDKGKDSIQLFIPIIKADSLQFTIENEAYSKTFISKIKEFKQTDSLEIQSSQRNLNFRDNLTLKTKTPINSIDKNKITLTNKDSIVIPFEYSYNEYEEEILFDFKKEENQKYTLEFLPEAVEDFYATKNDTLSFSFATKAQLTADFPDSNYRWNESHWTRGCDGSASRPWTAPWCLTCRGSPQGHPAHGPPA